MNTIDTKNTIFAGFSLIELLIVIAVASILLAVGIPSFRTFIDSQKIVTTASEFYGGINMTRAEAIKRGARVDMVATDGTNWNKGWTIFIDANDNHKVDAGETIIFTHEAIPTNMTLTGNFSDNSSPYISYTGNGRSRTNASSQTPQAGTATFVLGSYTRRVKINFLGRARICNPDTDTKTCGNNSSGS
ncbi:GspH/FimT family pseudopilin [Undibacterium sp. RuTC16W]|uniref:GspH/FimT family pseudopilin n=1 Tax=Undibacterium sp. RuTC16W TaxID=3413048 RepID=UPI003BF0A829